jgi:hypothetical protein
MNNALAIYLRNHDAAADAGVDLFRRAAASQRDRPYGPELAALRDEVEQDRKVYRRLLQAVRTPHDLVQSGALRLAERVGRLKPNGHLLRRAPLSDLIEVEAMLDAVRAKAAGWQALGTVADPPWAGEVDVADLLARALDQAARLERLHTTVATRVFTA